MQVLELSLVNVSYLNGLQLLPFYVRSLIQLLKLQVAQKVYKCSVYLLLKAYSLNKTFKSKKIVLFPALFWDVTKETHFIDQVH